MHAVIKLKFWNTAHPPSMSMGIAPHWPCSKHSTLCPHALTDVGKGRKAWLRKVARVAGSETMSLMQVPP
eukprot:1164391-Pyramimonas_sp.AAC.1